MRSDRFGRCALPLSLAALFLPLAAVSLAGCHRERSGDGSMAGDKPAASGETSGGSSAAAAAGEGAGPEKNTSVPSLAVKIPREDQSRAGIRIAAVVVRSMPQVLTVAGQVAMNERLTEHIGVLADGRITDVFVLPGDPVRRGQTLATLHSHSVHDTVATLLQAFAAQKRAESAVAFSTETRDRYGKLYSIQAASLEEKQRSEQDLAQARKNLADAEASVIAEREHLAELLQVPPASLRPDTLYNRELIPVRAVRDGVVISRSITPGQVVNTGDEAFVTSDLSTVWVSAAVNQKDVPAVRIGQAAAVTAQGEDPGKKDAAPSAVRAGGTGGTGGSIVRHGRVTMLGDLVDQQTRTLPVRIAVPNPGRSLRPGMFTTADIEESATRTAIFVPSAALQDVNGFQVVFVTADGVTFQARPVTTGVKSGDLVEVLQGLQPSDRVVVDGAFMVKGELLKGTVGEG